VIFGGTIASYETTIALYSMMAILT